MKNETILKIYVDGKLDRKATYLPQIKKRIIEFGNELNDMIVRAQQY